LDDRLIRNRLGAKIRELRTNAGLEQTDVAKAAGITQGYISMLEHGKRRLPSRDVVVSLARALLASEEDLLRVAGYLPPAVEIPNPELLNPELVILLAKIGILPAGDQQLMVDVLRPIIARNEAARRERDRG
jgi:transcriptional regulator with XRE-family HTH domain